MPKKPSEALAKVRKPIDDRLTEIDDETKQLDDERERLQSALAELVGGKAKKRPGRPRKASAGQAKKATTKPRVRRQRRGGTRADQALKVVEKEPGISASDVAKRMKIKPNYLYRVLGDLEKDGRVKKQGRQFFPAK